MPAIRAATLEGDYPECMTLRDRHAFRMGALTALLAIDEPIEPVAGIFRVAFENELEWRMLQLVPDHDRRSETPDI